jgi:hypothetical protein
VGKLPRRSACRVMIEKNASTRFNQVMYDSAGAVRDYQGGDLAGLAVLGRGPCESGP